MRENFGMENIGFTEAEVHEYLERIRFTASRSPTIGTLCELQKCHMQSVPFENLSVYGREEVVLSKDWLFNKVVRRHRGGFCFELNLLFSFLLDYFGFEHKMYGAQVSRSDTNGWGPPNDHMVLLVDIDGENWLTDVGFGDSALTPLLLSGKEQERANGTYRINKDGDHFVLEVKVKTTVAKDDPSVPLDSDNTTWLKQYRFDLVPKTTADFYEMCFYHQMDPRSIFTNGRVCTVAKPWGRITLSREKLITSNFLGDNKVIKETKVLLGGEEEVVNELELKFGIKKDSCFYPPGSIYFHE